MSARLYLAGAAVLGLLAIGAALYASGRLDEAKSNENKNLKATERQRAERDDIDAEMRKLDHAGLCRWINGLWRNGQCE